MTRRHFSRRALSQAASLGASALALPAAFGQTAAVWPSKPVRLVVPFAPGGTSEIVARAIASELGKQLGQSVYVENKPGGAGVLAMQEVAKAPPDGHTLILGHVGTLAVNPTMLKNQPYDVGRDFIPVTLLAKVPNVFVIHPDVPASNFKELVAYVKKNPGQLNYGSAGNASAASVSGRKSRLDRPTGNAARAGPPSAGAQRSRVQRRLPARQLQPSGARRLPHHRPRPGQNPLGQAA